MSWIGETLRDFREPLLGCLLVALACGLLGIHVLGRRMVLVGAALPQAAAAGIAFAFVAGGWSFTAPGGPGALLADHDVAAVLACGAATALLARRPGSRGGTPEAAAGAAFVLGGALSLLLVLRSPRGAEEIRNLVSGEILGIHDARLAWLAVTLGGAALFAAAGARRLALVSLDPETAAVLGVRVRAWDAAFLAAIAVTVARSVHAAGTLFVFAYLLLPAVAGLALARTVAGAHAVAATVAVVGAAGGFLAATHPEVDAPVGPAGAAAALLLAGGAKAWAALRRRPTS